MDISKDTMDKSLLDISKYLINEWRKLPRLVSMSHVKLLGVSSDFFSLFDLYGLIIFSA